MVYLEFLTLILKLEHVGGTAGVTALWSFLFFLLHATDAPMHVEIKANSVCPNA